jgi:hypothetical protein
MDDRDILYYIGKLVDEERKLMQQQKQDGLTQDQRVHMQQIGIYLDECWDLLRQRRARRKAGLDPADARLPDETSIEYFAQ